MYVSVYVRVWVCLWHRNSASPSLSQPCLALALSRFLSLSVCGSLSVDTSWPLFDRYGNRPGQAGVAMAAMAIGCGCWGWKLLLEGEPSAFRLRQSSAAAPEI